VGSLDSGIDVIGNETKSSKTLETDTNGDKKPERRTQKKRTTKTYTKTRMTLKGKHNLNKLRHAGCRVLREIPSCGLNQGKSPCVLVSALWKGRGCITRTLTKQSSGCHPRCPRMHPRHLARQVGARYSSSLAPSTSASSTTASLVSLWPCLGRRRCSLPGRLA
jgi:hypothetical protein